MSGFQFDNCIQLHFSIAEATKVRIAFYDMNAKLLYENSITLVETYTHRLMIPLSRLQNGTNAILVNAQTDNEKGR